MHDDGIEVLVVAVMMMEEKSMSLLRRTIWKEVREERGLFIKSTEG